MNVSSVENPAEFVDNIAIFVQPKKQANDSGPWFIAGVAGDPDCQRIVNLKTALPPLWKGKYLSHFVNVPVGHSWARDNNVSHLALLESEHMPEPADPIYFGGESIEHNGVLLWFSEAEQQYHFFQNRTAAIAVLQWMIEQQEEWQATARPAGRA